MMKHALPTWIRVSALGGHAQLVLALILGLWMCWIVWPVGARVRWDPRQEWQARTATGSDARYVGAHIAPDGTVLIETSVDVRFYAANDFALTQTLPITASSITLSPDHRIIAAKPQSSSGAGLVRLYRADDGALLQTLPGPPDKRVLWVVWSPDSRVLAVRHVEPEHYLFWDSGTGRQIAPPFPQPAMVLGMAYTRGGEIVLLSTPDTLIALRTRDGHEIYHSPIPASQLVLTPDESMLLAYEQGHIRAMRTSDGALLWTLGIENTDWNRSLRFPEVGAIAVSPDNQYLAVGEIRSRGYFFNFPETGRIALVRMADGTIARWYQGQASGVGSIGFTPDSQTFLSRGSSEIVRWDVAPLPPWLIWLPGVGLAMLLLHALWQWSRRRGQQIRGHA